MNTIKRPAMFYGIRIEKMDAEDILAFLNDFIPISSEAFSGVERSITNRILAIPEMRVMLPYLYAVHREQHLEKNKTLLEYLPPIVLLQTIVDSRRREASYDTLGLFQILNLGLDAAIHRYLTMQQDCNRNPLPSGKNINTTELLDKFYAAVYSNRYRVVEWATEHLVDVYVQNGDENYDILNAVNLFKGSYGVSILSRWFAVIFYNHLMYGDLNSQLTVVYKVEEVKELKYITIEFKNNLVGQSPSRIPLDLLGIADEIKNLNKFSGYADNNLNLFSTSDESNVYTTKVWIATVSLIV